MTSVPNSSRRAGPILASLLGLGVVVLGILVVWRLDRAPRTDDAYVYADTINVAPEVSGRIVELAVCDNQAVKCGDVLFRLDPRPYRAVLAKAEAALVALDNEIMLAQRAVAAQAFAAQVAGAAVERARATAKQAADTLDRMEPLQAAAFLSSEQIDQARTAKLTAEASLEGALLERRRAQAAVSGVEALVARKAVLTAEIDLARLNLDYATVVAPLDGIVINLKTAVGQFAAAGRPVFTMVATRNWYVVANFRETELRDIRPGQRATLHVLGQHSAPFEGVVESIGYGVFPDDGGGEVGGLPRVPRSINWVRVAQRFPVKILVPQPQPELFRLGASAVAVMQPAPIAERP